MGSDRFWRFLRYVVMVCFALWAFAAAILKLWNAMLFFVAYMVFIYVLGTLGDREREREREDG